MQVSNILLPQPQILNICLNICLIMNFKTLTVKKSVYERLLAIKREKESFSDLFERLSKKDIMAIKRLRGCTEFKEKDTMIKDINKKRNEKRYG